MMAAAPPDARGVLPAGADPRARGGSPGSGSARAEVGSAGSSRKPPAASPPRSLRATSPAVAGEDQHRASRRVAVLQHLEGEPVEVAQDLVHLMAPPVGGALAGRRSGPQRPGAAGGAGLFPRFPAGEAPCLSGQVVECGAERLEPERQAGGVERIVGRGRQAGRDRRRRGDAGKRDAGNAWSAPDGGGGPSTSSGDAGADRAAAGRSDLLSAMATLKGGRPAADRCRCRRVCAERSRAAWACAGAAAAASPRAP